MGTLAQEITFQACIREVHVWKFGQGIANSEASLGFPQSVQGDDGIVPQLGHDRFLRYSFQLITHQSSYHLILTSYNKS
jgi:hypothetical protein